MTPQEIDSLRLLPPMPRMVGLRMESDPQELMDVHEEVLEGLLSRVLLFNDEIHTFDEVISQVMKATGCTSSRAESIAWEVHTRGVSQVFEGELFECLVVSSILEEIALHTQVMT